MNPMQLNLEGLEIQKWNIPTDRASSVDEIWDYLPSYQVYSQSYGH